MKPLPVIQPPLPKSSESPAPQPLQTAEMVSDPAKSASLMPQIVRALSTVCDPEIPVNVYDLGLIYEVIVDASSRVGIRMTLTAPACPAAQFLPGHVKKAVETLANVTDVTVDVVWDPPWTRDHMSETAKLQLGMF